MNGDHLNPEAVMERFRRFEDKIGAVEKNLVEKIGQLGGQISVSMSRIDDHEKVWRSVASRLASVESLCKTCPSLREAQTAEIHRDIQGLQKEHAAMWSRINSNSRWILMASGGVAVLVFFLSVFGEWLRSHILGGG